MFLQFVNNSRINYTAMEGDQNLWEMVVYFKMFLFRQSFLRMRKRGAGWEHGEDVLVR